MMTAEPCRVVGDGIVVTTVAAERVGEVNCFVGEAAPSAAKAAATAGEGPEVTPRRYGAGDEVTEEVEATTFCCCEWTGDAVPADWPPEVEEDFGMNVNDDDEADDWEGR